MNIDDEASAANGPPTAPPQAAHPTGASIDDAEQPSPLLPVTAGQQLVPDNANSNPTTSSSDPHSYHVHDDVHPGASSSSIDAKQQQQQQQQQQPHPAAPATSTTAAPIVRSMRSAQRTVSESALRCDDVDVPAASILSASSSDCPLPIVGEASGGGRSTPSPMAAAAAAGRRSRLRSYCDQRSTASAGVGGGSAGSTSSLSSTGFGGHSYSTARRVSFPENDAELVTGYLEPANPWATVKPINCISELSELYRDSCAKHCAQPIEAIVQHLDSLDDLSATVRRPLLNLREHRLSAASCEALEEVLKRVQYKLIDLTDCDLDDVSATALFDMIEYYEAANEIDISENRKITTRGWQSCINMIKRSHALQTLSTRGMPLSESNAINMGKALLGSSLHTLKLEHCGLSGRPMTSLCNYLRRNTVLKELWLAHNDLCHIDAFNIAIVLKANYHLQFLDVSNNKIEDVGLLHITDALLEQARHLRTLQEDVIKAAVAAAAAAVAAAATAEAAAAVAAAALVDDEEGNRNNSSSSLSIGAGDEPDERPIEILSTTPDDASSASLTDLSASPSSQSLLDYASIDDDDDVVREAATDDVATELPVILMEQGAMKPARSTLESLLHTQKLQAEEIAAMQTTTTATAASTDSAAIDGVAVADDDVASTTRTDEMRMFEDCENSVANNLNNNQMPPVLRDEPRNADVDVDTPLSAFDLNENTPAQHKQEPAELLDNLLHDHAKLNEDHQLQPPAEISSAQVISKPAVESMQPPSATAATTVTIVDDLNAPQPAQIDSRIKKPCCTASGPPTNASSPANPAALNSPTAPGLAVVRDQLLAERLHEATISTVEEVACEMVEAAVTEPLPTPLALTSFAAMTVPTMPSTSGAALTTANLKSMDAAAAAADAAASSPVAVANQPAAHHHQHLQHHLHHHHHHLHHLHGKLATTPLLSKSLDSSFSSPAAVAASAAAALRLDATTTSAADATIDHCDRPERSFSLESLNSETSVDSNDSKSSLKLAEQKFNRNGTLERQQKQQQSAAATAVAAAQRTVVTTGADAATVATTASSSSHTVSALLNNAALAALTPNGQPAANGGSQQQQQQQPFASGLQVLILWNNGLTRDSAKPFGDLLAETSSLEILNIGRNVLSNDFIANVRDSLKANTSLTSVGLQSAHLTCAGLRTLAECLEFGGNATLQRIDVRDNHLQVAGLTALNDVLKSNKTLTRVDLDDVPRRAHDLCADSTIDYSRMVHNIRAQCARNENPPKPEPVRTTAINKRVRSSHLSSRKISLTCHSIRPAAETSSPHQAGTPHSGTAGAGTAQTGLLLNPERKAGRLRSPAPSPIPSPTPSPSRNRFQVVRVLETSPIATQSQSATTSPMTPPPLPLQQQQPQQQQQRQHPMATLMSTSCPPTSCFPASQSAPKLSRFRVTTVAEPSPAQRAPHPTIVVVAGGAGAAPVAPAAAAVGLTKHKSVPVNLHQHDDVETTKTTTTTTATTSTTTTDAVLISTQTTTAATVTPAPLLPTTTTATAAVAGPHEIIMEHHQHYEHHRPVLALKTKHPHPTTNTNTSVTPSPSCPPSLIASHHRSAIDTPTSARIECVVRAASALPSSSAAVDPLNQSSNRHLTSPIPFSQATPQSKLSDLRQPAAAAASPSTSSTTAVAVQPPAAIQPHIQLPFSKSPNQSGASLFSTSLDSPDMEVKRYMDDSCSSISSMDSINYHGDLNTSLSSVDSLDALRSHTSPVALLVKPTAAPTVATTTPTTAPTITLYATASTTPTTTTTTTTTTPHQPIPIVIDRSRCSNAASLTAAAPTNSSPAPPPQQRGILGILRHSPRPPAVAAMQLDVSATLSADATTSPCSSSSSSCRTPSPGEPMPSSSSPAAELASSAKRARKTSVVSTGSGMSGSYPATLDKLLSLFQHPGNFFARQSPSAGDDQPAAVPDPPPSTTTTTASMAPPQQAPVTSSNSTTSTSTATTTSTSTGLSSSAAVGAHMSHLFGWTAGIVVRKDPPPELSPTTSTTSSSDSAATATSGTSATSTSSAPSAPTTSSSSSGPASAASAPTPAAPQSSSLSSSASSSASSATTSPTTSSSRSPTATHASKPSPLQQNNCTPGSAAAAAATIPANSTAAIATASTTTATTTTTTTTSIGPTGTVVEIQSLIAMQSDPLPLDRLQREMKENISPEHTVTSLRSAKAQPLHVHGASVVSVVSGSGPVKSVPPVGPAADVERVRFELGGDDDEEDDDDDDGETRDAHHSDIDDEENDDDDDDDDDDDYDDDEHDVKPNATTTNDESLTHTTINAAATPKPTATASSGSHQRTPIRRTRRTRRNSAQQLRKRQRHRSASDDRPAASPPTTTPPTFGPDSIADMCSTRTSAAAAAAASMAPVPSTASSNNATAGLGGLGQITRDSLSILHGNVSASNRSHDSMRSLESLGESDTDVFQ